VITHCSNARTGSRSNTCRAGDGEPAPPPAPGDLRKLPHEDVSPPPRPPLPSHATRHNRPSDEPAARAARPPVTGGDDDLAQGCGPGRSARLITAGRRYQADEPRRSSHDRPVWPDPVTRSAQRRADRQARAGPGAAADRSDRPGPRHQATAGRSPAVRHSEPRRT
jgi:hypothetical protein